MKTIEYIVQERTAGLGKDWYDHPELNSYQNECEAVAACIHQNATSDIYEYRVIRRTEEDVASANGGGQLPAADKKGTNGN